MANFHLRSDTKKRIPNVLKRIGRLLEQGYPLDISLIFIKQYVSKQIEHSLDVVLAHLKEGYTIHESFSLIKVPKSTLLFLYFYEKQGDISEGFIQAGTYLEQQMKFKQQFLKLISYPLILISFCLFLLGFMYQFVLPNFKSYFLTTQSSSIYSELLLQGVYYLPYTLPVIFISLLVVFGFYYIKLKAKSAYDLALHFISFPILGMFLQTLITYFFSLQLGRLLCAGMSIKQSLQQFEQQNYYSLFQLEGINLMNGLRDGYTLPDLIGVSPLYLKELGFVLENGAKTGYLATDLIQYSEILYLELEYLIQKYLKRIQPVAFLIVGGFIFLLFLLTLMPIYEMMNNV